VKRRTIQVKAFGASSMTIERYMTVEMLTFYLSHGGAGILAVRRRALQRSAVIGEWAPTPNPRSILS